MASVKLVQMSQESNNHFPSYLPEQNLRSSVGIKGGLWSSAPPATPQTSNASMSSVWGSPIPVLPAHSSSSGSQILNSSGGGIAQAFRSHSSGSVEPAPQSLAALAADSEPVLSHIHTSPAPVAFPPPLSSANSRFSSRQNSQTDITPPMLLNSASSGSTPPGSAISPNQSNSAKQNAPWNDEIINTAIVVKNIPFAIKKEQLIDFMTQLGLPLPYAFNYHFDNGVFRGLAFANFTSAEETAIVIPSLNGRELGGRKLRVEYKKMLPFQERERIEREKRERRGQLEEQHQQSAQNKPSHGNSQSSSQQHQFNGSSSGNSQAPPTQGISQTSPFNASQPPSASGSPRPARSLLLSIDMNDQETLQTYSSLLLFKCDITQMELMIPPAQVSQLSVSQIDMMKILCQRLDLNCLVSDEQGIVVSKSLDSGLLYKSSPEPNYLNGVFVNALTTPASTSSFARTRVGPPVAAPAVNNLSAMNALNRWNSVNNAGDLNGQALGSSLGPK